jgi:hypothetical protein
MNMNDDQSFDEYSTISDTCLNLPNNLKVLSIVSYRPIMSLRAFLTHEKNAHNHHHPPNLFFG